MAPATNPTQEVTMFDHTTRGTLPAGTTTEFGVIAGRSYTAYEMADGSYVSFDEVHGRPRMAEPLVRFGW